MLLCMQSILEAKTVGPQVCSVATIYNTCMCMFSVLARICNRSGQWVWSCDWLEEIASRFTREEWRDNFRLSSETFEYICNELSPQLLRQDTCMRKAVGVKTSVAIALWRL